MAKLKNIIALTLAIGCILINLSCDNRYPPLADAGSDTTITLPTSGISLLGSGMVARNRTIISYSWTQQKGPLAAIISSSSTASTNITGLSVPGEWIFVLTVKDDAGRMGTDEVNITVNASNSMFKISSNIYTVQNISIAGKQVKAESYRNATDSGVMIFSFLTDTSLPATGFTRVYKVVPSLFIGPLPIAFDEVRVSVTQFNGTDGTGYACTGTDNVKATVTVSSGGKIVIKMPVAIAAKLVTGETIQVSADIREQ